MKTTDSAWSILSFPTRLHWSSNLFHSSWKSWWLKHCLLWWQRYFPHNLLKSYTLCSLLQTDFITWKWRVELTWGLLFQDDIITVISRVDENWAEGKLGDKVGIFPILFVEVCESPIYSWLKHAQKRLCACPSDAWGKFLFNLRLRTHWNL